MTKPEIAELMSKPIHTTSDWESLTAKERKEIVELADYSKQRHPDLRYVKGFLHKMSKEDRDLLMPEIEHLRSYEEFSLETHCDEFPTVGKPLWEIAAIFTNENTPFWDTLFEST